ncbi:MAG: 30S ribosomal protein S4 [Syntrophales bacterium]|nr:30S ribosomal protein S4 [Syntrophales bacterium]MDD5233570.1 30S ribosomal protein S4 [Syntrophales bacterium]MDD5532348.1 30S ribosomal protein S4 [Syntrophales bacterium]HPL63933.1 30S ribosomal protein S4 [Syntrophales bacterium]
MARYRESLCRQCRSEGVKLFLKGDRCYTDKCASERRGYAPGEHGQMRKKLSDYGVQLREKQKLKKMYGLLESQFRNYFKKSDRQKGVTGSNLLIMLERRLDNIVFRLGFANSRAEARQLVMHSHFRINGKKVNIPSYLVSAGSVIEVSEKSRNMARIKESLETVARRGLPQWLELDKANFRGVLKALPTREDLVMPIQEQLIVELYSK